MAGLAWKLGQLLASGGPLDLTRGWIPKASALGLDAGGLLRKCCIAAIVLLVSGCCSCNFDSFQPQPGQARRALSAPSLQWTSTIAVYRDFRMSDVYSRDGQNLIGHGARWGSPYSYVLFRSNDYGQSWFYADVPWTVESLLPALDGAPMEVYFHPGFAFSFAEGEPGKLISTFGRAPNASIEGMAGVGQRPFAIATDSDECCAVSQGTNRTLIYRRILPTDHSSSSALWVVAKRFDPKDVNNRHRICRMSANGRQIVGAATASFVIACNSDNEAGRAVWFSVDGVSWRQFLDVSPARIVTIRARPGQLYALVLRGAQSYIEEYDDLTGQREGATLAPDGTRDIEIAPDGSLLVAHGGAISRRSEASWTRVLEASSRSYSLRATPLGVLALGGTNSSSLYRSDNTGTSWVELKLNAAQ